MTTKKQLPDNWWDYGINPIVGFKVPKVGDKKVHKRNVYEYPYNRTYHPYHYN